MGFRCVICSESLERQPPGTSGTDEVKICSLPCGHMLHQYCIDTWTKGNLPTCSQCPVCRKNIPGLKTLPLYPDTHALDDLDAEPPCNHDSEINRLNKVMIGLKRKVENGELIQKALREDLEHERVGKKEVACKLEALQMKYIDTTRVKRHQEQENKKPDTLPTKKFKTHEKVERNVDEQPRSGKGVINNDQAGCTVNTDLSAGPKQANADTASDKSSSDNILDEVPDDL